MTVTSTKVTFGLYALAIKQDSDPSASNLQPFSDITDLRTDSLTSKPFCTFEPNFWLLDGNYKFLPDDLTTVHVGMMSLAMSSASGWFATAPVLTVDFNQAHSVDNGLTLHFSPYTDDYASYINVKYYDSGYSVISNKDYYPSTADFSTNLAVSNFKRIVITFYATNKPLRYLRLRGIDYGTLIIFSGEDIKKASLIEETDMLGGEARINTFEVELFSSDSQFSIIGPEGNYASLLQNQPVSVYALVDNEELFMGQYYLEKWTNSSEVEVKFECVDLMGVIESIGYLGNIWTGSGTALSSVLATMLGSPLYIPYELDQTLDNVMVKGWLPISNLREALQQICFAANAYVDTSRDRVLKIRPIKLPATDDEYWDYVIDNTQKGLTDSNLALRPLVTRVEVTAHNFYAGSESKSLYNGTLAVGSYRITFPQPMHTLQVSGATIASSGPNHAVLTVSSPGTVTLSGLCYVDTQRVYGIDATGVDPSVKANINAVRGATLVNDSNVASVTQRVFDYYAQRYLLKTKLISPFAEPGNIVLIDALYDKQIRAAVEKMVVDLAGGFLVTTEMVGVEHVVA